MSTNATAAKNVAFEQINEQGTYVCNWNGHLLQIPKSGVVNGTPCWNLFSNEDLYVTKISDDNTISVDKARQIAGQYDLPINF